MGKRKNKSFAKRQDPDELTQDEEDLDRFAGSSAEEDNKQDENEDNDDDDDLSHDERVVMKVFPGERDHDNALADDEDSDSGSNSDSNEQHQRPADKQKEETDTVDSSSSDDDDKGHGGLANAMARILGTQQQGTKPLVLSKTTTRIQKQAAAQRQHDKDMKEKRQHNRERELQALHIPLSVATTHQVSLSSNSSNKSNALVKELEMERVHRRVATRGVVALFNAISQHQNQATKDKESALLSTSLKRADIKKMTKHSFLDMIKSKATATTSGSTIGNEATTHKQTGEEGPQWKALQDDYMMNPKKNWDQESSDDDGVDDQQDNGDSAFLPKKRRKTATVSN